MPVEGEFKNVQRVRQALPDTPKRSNFLSFAKSLKFILWVTQPDTLIKAKFYFKKL